MKFVAAAVTAVAALEALFLAFIPFAQSGVMGENTEGDPFLQPLTTLTYWLTAAPCLVAVVVLAYCTLSVSVYPRSSRKAILRTGSLVGFAFINLGYFVFAICVGLIDDNPAMFGYSLYGLATFVLAGALLHVRPRHVGPA